MKQQRPKALKIHSHKKANALIYYNLGFYTLREVLHFYLLNGTSLKSSPHFQISGLKTIIGSAFMTNFFTLFLSAEGFIKKDIFKVYASVFKMARTALLQFSFAIALDVPGKNDPFVGMLSVSGSYAIEPMVMLYFVYRHRHEAWQNIYKKLGPKKNINKAFLGRNLLHSLVREEVFNISLFWMNFGSKFKNESFFYCLLVYLITIISFAQLLLISVFISQEDRNQRKFAIGFSALRSLLSIALTVLLLKPNKNIRSAYILILYMADITLSSFIIFFVLVMDTLMFGSGLKERFKLNVSNLKI